MRRGFVVEHSFPGLSFNQSTWRPEILLKGKPSRDEEEVTWSSNWDFLFTGVFQRQREHYWSFFVASSPGDWTFSNYGAAFDMHRILMPFDDFSIKVLISQT